MIIDMVVFYLAGCIFMDLLSFTWMGDFIPLRIVGLAIFSLFLAKDRFCLSVGSKVIRLPIMQRISIGQVVKKNMIVGIVLLMLFYMGEAYTFVVGGVTIKTPLWYKIVTVTVPFLLLAFELITGFGLRWAKISLED